QARGRAANIARRHGNHCPAVERCTRNPAKDAPPSGTGHQTGRRCTAARPVPARRLRTGDQKNPSASAW
ncbi:hypothetical protein, partial [Burkholderia territorii]|uniref:hypothetical protein n=1 Tax=Burkholderia territorii TaxID=1503055 RepID=UPI001BAD9CF1